MSNLKQLTWWLVILGALNLGTTALNVNFLLAIFGGLGASVMTVINVIIGLAAAYQLFELSGKKK